MFLASISSLEPILATYNFTVDFVTYPLKTKDAMSYYDVDAILTDSQKLPCTFELDVPGLGYLDGNPGQTVSIPQAISMTMFYICSPSNEES